jgi:Holliday junction resolvase RusA-like endonuclease
MISDARQEGWPNGHASRVRCRRTTHLESAKYAAGRANLAAWKATIAGAAALAWANAPLTIELKVIIINFYAGNEPSVDTDNMSKPILDVMQGIAYLNDRQIIQAELTHANLGGAYQIGGVRPVMVNGLQAQAQFVYVRIEDPVNPFPLPK